MLKLALSGNGLALQMLKKIGNGYLNGLNELDIEQRSEYHNLDREIEDWKKMYSDDEINAFTTYLRSEGIDWEYFEHSDPGSNVTFHYKKMKLIVIEN